MLSRFALAVGLGLTFCTPVLAETFMNPDRAWWNTFFEAVDGRVPDFEKLAKETPEYRAADEFSRDEVLAEIIARLEAEQAQIDVANAEVTISIRARFGDYSAANNGFPVNLFSQNQYLQLNHNNLFFRNWQDFNIYPATRDEGRDLRARIGTQDLAAEVTLGDFRKSTTRANAYDGHITKVVYSAADGTPIGEATAPEKVEISADEASEKLNAARALVVEAAGIPPLGTSWAEAKVLLQLPPIPYPIIASDQFYYNDSGKVLAFLYEGGLHMDAPHEADQPFRIYLQQVDGDWRTRPGFSVDMNDLMYGIDAVDTKGVGPGLECYTPDRLDRCAVLEFSPAEKGHVLTRAYGVIEQKRQGTVDEVFKAFLGDTVGVFETFTAPLGYNGESIRQGAAPQATGRGRSLSYMGGAGAMHSGDPLYNPLKNTVGVNAINREIALFAVDGSEMRVPLVFVLQ